MKLLLDKGARIETQDNSKDTALQAASYRSLVYAINLLVDKGADVNAKVDAIVQRFKLPLLKVTCMLPRYYQLEKLRLMPEVTLQNRTSSGYDRRDRTIDNSRS